MIYWSATPWPLHLDCVPFYVQFNLFGDTKQLAAVGLTPCFAVYFTIPLLVFVKCMQKSFFSLGGHLATLFHSSPLAIPL